MVLGHRVPISGARRLGLSAERATRLHLARKTRGRNAFIESFNGRLRDECLNMHQFALLAEAQTIIEAWRLDYNQRRPHGSLGHLTPNEFVAQRQVIWATEEAVGSS